MLRKVSFSLARRFLSERTIRLLYYDLLRGWARFRRIGQSEVEPPSPLLNLGCGRRRFPGWLNVDLSGSDYDVDLSAGKLPWRSAAFDAASCQHFVEHLDLEEELVPLLREMRRVLKLGGEAWISTPDVEKICRAYQEDRLAVFRADRMARFPDYPFSHDPAMPDQQMINHYFHQLGQHKNLFDFDLLRWALREAGFVNIRRVCEADLLARFSDIPARRDDLHSLYVYAENPVMILHITPRADWETAQTAGEYRAASLEHEGFIHFSTAEQVIGVANAFYRGQRDLVLLIIDPARLAADLRWEPPAHPGARVDVPDASGDLFPHLYGPLNLDAVNAVIDFPPREDGAFDMPPLTQIG